MSIGCAMYRVRIVYVPVKLELDAELLCGLLEASCETVHTTARLFERLVDLNHGELVELVFELPFFSDGDVELLCIVLCHELVIVFA